ncbi:PHB depolymerase family esterase [Cellulosimicrobium sp. Marseille-Q4280]|uniref:prolyl oligopeptidase family serine peptidase n=1 Tax=Cellulosimicrobium sp. Marseille-Q4280 TaxID=2937992 RepID=UPI00203FAC89|nr:PHB depolymerase family esterase [Cellulosimicrobium sp. Marseille-Q4280]
MHVLPHRWRIAAAAVASLALTAVAAPGVAAPRDDPPGRVAETTFTLDAEVLDSGEQVTGITIDAHRLRTIDPASLSTGTFTVRAVGAYPDDVDRGGRPQQVFDVERTLTGVELTRSGDIHLELASGFGTPGADTLTYQPVGGRNVLLDLTYTMVQNAPLELRNGRDVTIRGFVQGDLVDPEVDAFRAGVSGTGLNYRLFTPDRRGGGDRALVVWLHGNGEGGLGGYYDNEPPLRANRGALGFATPEAQKILGGAYVLVPQVPDTWYNADSAGYQERLRALVDEIAGRYKVDTDRIHVAGASAGGYMATRLVAAYPDDFASLAVSAPAYYTGGTYRIDAAEIAALEGTPTWFVHARNDPTVPYAETSVWAHEQLPGSILSLYDDVTWDGVTYPGHWSWIYQARNAPTTPEGLSLWEWTAQQSLDDQV